MYKLLRDPSIIHSKIVIDKYILYNLKKYKTIY